MKGTAKHVLAWTLPAFSVLSTTIFFVFMAVCDPAVARRARGGALDRATAIAFGILILTVLGVLLYAFVAEHAQDEST